MTMDTKEIAAEWHFDNAAIKRPKLRDACDMIVKLCVELNKQRAETAFQKRRQDLKEQHYKTMMVELQNVVNKYT